jgi:beta-galactosidase GanA
MGQEQFSIPHLRKQGTAQQLVVDGEPFVMLSGEVHNSSASSLVYMEPAWDRLAAMHLNTVIVPLYWELIEPSEGEFDFLLLEGLLEGARRRDLHLVLLWFASWKNATSSYVPAWVKADPKRFPRLQIIPGKDANALSCLSQEARDADARAFAAVMRRLRELDAGQHTVLMMQVENEPGVLGGARDRSRVAERAFGGPVPQALIDYMTAHEQVLSPELREHWAATHNRTSGTWSQVFDDAANEVFMAWHVGQYIDYVAAAGKAEYHLPMYANAWLKVSEEELPGYYPSGGPVYTMLDVWKASAPHIDLLAPDIYAADFRRVCAQYTRPDNALFIPEAHRDARAASTVFYALGQHDALGFAPFGIDSAPQPHPLADSYQLLASMAPLIAAQQGTGQMAGVLQQDDEKEWEIELGQYVLHVETNQPMDPGQPPGGGLIIALGEDEFVVAGRNLFIEFGTAAGQVDVEFLWLEEGTFQEGRWVPQRRLNGDETNHGRTVKLRDRLAALKLKLNAKVVPIYHQQRAIP